mgnify:CR=1 FL=1
MNLSAIPDLLREAVVPLAVVGGSVLLGLLISLLLVGVARRIVGRRNPEIAEEVRSRLQLPSLLLTPVVLVFIFLPLADLPETVLRPVRNVLEVAIIVSAVWLVMRGFRLMESAVDSRYPVNVEDNLKARKVHTQIHYLRQIASFLVAFIGFGVILLMFEEIRQLGATLLTTAGVAGIIVGFAAQKTLSMIIAGLQIAFTQPVRLGDAVIVENEWGWIEEITLTYVVIKVWDWRRLVVPINYFLDNVIQNWTRSSSRLIGTVYLSVDYTFPVDELRTELQQILSETSLWDRGVSVVQVVDATEKAMSVRVLVTAKDSPTLWDLRCLVRERLIAFLRDTHGVHLPKLRAEIGGEHPMPDGAVSPSVEAPQK